MIVALQILRGLAALAVACAHLPWAVYRDTVSTRIPDLTVSFSGVDIFFVLSGVVMAITIGPARGFRAGMDFLSRRAVRVLPLYWVATAVALLQMASDYGTQHLPLDGAARRTAITSLLLLPHVSSGDPLDFYPIVVQGWTLEYEAFFYVVLAVAIACGTRYRMTSASLVILALCGIGAMMDLPTPLFQYTRTNSIEFVFGLAIGCAYLRAIRIPTPVAIALMAAGVIGLVAFAPFSDGFDAWRGFGWGVPAAAIVGAATLMPRQQPEAPRSFLMRAGLSLGNASYSLYLCHTFVYDLWYYVVTGSRLQIAVSAKIMPMMLASAVVGGLLVHRFVERPLIEDTRARLKARAKLLGEGR